MFRLQIVLVLFALTLAVSHVKCSNELDSNELKIENFIDENFRFKALAQLLKEPFKKNVSQRLQLKHTLGTRRDGDRLLLRYKSPIKSSESRLDIKQSETFEFEAYITYVEVIVEQSTNESQLKASSGGEGSKYIELTIEAKHTYYFFYTTEIYGYF